MPRRATLACIAGAIVSIAPLAGTAHAQDLDCRNFTYQEDAQAVYDQDRSDPNRLDEDQGPDDGIACEVLPRRTAALTTPASPSAPSSVLPTLGARAGVGGASASHPSGWDIAIGACLTTGAALAVGYVALHHRGRLHRLVARGSHDKQ
ncbi:excalibur calcium-binding protein [Streptomyces liliiviolaceus]|uniref:excalibur calcium-binding protein n=1 Tax=Streptomyces liliiviolaceus TaxID=2823109 RepID=UPI001FFCDC92|nr:excalibur calcium-binding protein [Streptomyces liliiviolaceus]